MGHKIYFYGKILIIIPKVSLLPLLIWSTGGTIWAHLFKTNDVICYRFIKFSEVNFSNMPIFFVEKLREAFALQKLLSFFSTKNFSVFGYKVVKHVTSWPNNELVKLTML